MATYTASSSHMQSEKIRRCVFEATEVAGGDKEHLTSLESFFFDVQEYLLFYASDYLRNQFIDDPFTTHFSITI